MTAVCIRLFGRLNVSAQGTVLSGFESRKVQELFSFLVLNHQQPHAREVLATLLWSESPTAQSRKLLRHTLWQLQTILEQATPACEPLLCVEPEWIKLNLSTHVWVDALAFLQADAHSQGLRPEHLPEPTVAELAVAVDLHQGELLEGCYHDWCLYERERFHTRLLDMLDRLVVYSIGKNHFEQALEYGQRVLRHDRTRERTHRQLMRLHYLRGDRSEALQQFRRCAAALGEDFGVEPSRKTLELLAQIREERLGEDAPVVEASRPALASVLGDLQHMCAALVSMEQQLKTHIASVERALHERH